MNRASDVSEAVLGAVAYVASHTPQDASESMLQAALELELQLRLPEGWVARREVEIPLRFRSSRGESFVLGSVRADMVLYHGGEARAVLELKAVGKVTPAMLLQAHKYAHALPSVREAFLANFPQGPGATAAVGAQALTRMPADGGYSFAPDLEPGGGFLLLRGQREEEDRLRWAALTLSS